MKPLPYGRGSDREHFSFEIPLGSFQQHVTCSTLTGIAIGGIAYQVGFSLPTSMLAAGLCSMAGMLPDIDSDSSRSFQECIYFAAGLCAVLLVERLRRFGIDQDIILLGGGGMFLFVRFVVGDFIKKMTAHRGMFHSVPAAVLAGELTFFLSTGTVAERVFKALALTAGFLSHLILDEICSIDSTGKTLRLKKSFGTALKFFDSKRAGTALTLYAVVVFLGMTALKNPEMIETLQGMQRQVAADQDTPARSVDAVAVERIVTRQASYSVPTTSSAGLSIPRETTVATTAQVSTQPVLGNNQRYSERLILNRVRGSTAERSTTTSTQMPTLTPLATSPPAAMEPGLRIPQETSVSPVQAQTQTPAQPALQSNIAVSPSVPFGLSGSDFAPRRSTFSSPTTTALPAPLMLP